MNFGFVFSCCYVSEFLFIKKLFSLFRGEGYIEILYYFILISHIILSIALIPLVLISYVRAFQKEFPSHKKISKITNSLLTWH